MNNQENKQQYLQPNGNLRTEINLDYIGNQIAQAVSQKTGHALNASDFMAIYLSPDVKLPNHDTDAICFCTLQFNFYKIKKHQPSLTPLYFYNSLNHNVTKMGNTLGSPEPIVDKLNTQYGLTLMPIKQLLNGHEAKIVSH